MSSTRSQRARAHGPQIRVSPDAGRVMMPVGAVMVAAPSAMTTSPAVSPAMCSSDNPATCESTRTARSRRPTQPADGKARSASWVSCCWSIIRFRPFCGHEPGGRHGDQLAPAGGPCTSLATVSIDVQRSESGDRRRRSTRRLAALEMLLGWARRVVRHHRRMARYADQVTTAVLPLLGLGQQVLGDLDTEEGGITWWSDSLDAPRRILIADYLIELSGSCEANLVEAVMHLERVKQDWFAAGHDFQEASRSLRGQKSLFPRTERAENREVEATAHVA